MRLPTVHMHISEAYLCPCGIVGNSATQCACGNEQGLLSLSVVLDREQLTAPTHERVQALIEVLDECFA
jgi:hypothetical protein